MLNSDYEIILPIDHVCGVKWIDWIDLLMTDHANHLKEPAMPAKLQASSEKIKEAIFAGKLLPSMNFVEKVWAICSRIPEGKVVTYGDIAAKLDSKGYRAVGMAMNRNPYAPTVPCHRVVGSTGKLTGYAGGLDKKQRMLITEKVPMRGEDQVDLAAARHKL